MRNKFGALSFIETGTNKAYSTTESRWKLIPEGSTIRFGDDDAFYTIAGVEELFYIKKFHKISRNAIEILEDVKLNMVPSDIATISHKQFTLFEHHILDCGQNYKKGDIIVINGGLSTVNTYDMSKNETALKITKLNSTGGIVEMDIISSGNYLTTPNELFDVDTNSKQFFEAYNFVSYSHF